LQKLLTYNDFVKLIETMSPEDRNRPMLSQNSNTGAFFGFNGIRQVEDGECELMPVGHPVLADDYNWLWYQNGEIKRSRYEPDWDAIRKLVI